MFARKKPKERAINVFDQGSVRLSVNGFQLARWALERPAFKTRLINRDRGLDGTIKAALFAAETGTHFSYPDLGVGICLYLIMAEQSGCPFDPVLNPVESYLRHLRVHRIISSGHKLIPLFLALTLHDYYSDEPPTPFGKGVYSINVFSDVESWLALRLLLE